MSRRSSVSRPATDDPFELLGLPPSFRLDAAAIRAAQVRRMTLVHPDRAAGPAQAADFARLAAAINDAARRLGDPITRGEALLRRARSGTAGQTGGGEPIAPDAMFLMEAMELREALDEAIESGDAERLAILRADAEGRYEEACEAAADALDALGHSIPSPAPAPSRDAEQALARLRYATRLRDRARHPTSHADGARDERPDARPDERVGGGG
jgi:DnaJ-domain-containing protein 1